MCMGNTDLCGLHEHILETSVNKRNKDNFTPKQSNTKKYLDFRCIQFEWK